jgi:putative ABC transport system permease protein
VYVRTLLIDVYQALRLLLKTRRFTAIVVVTLAVGIASNTVVFGVVRSVFLRPLPYPDANRLVYVSQSYPGNPEGGAQFSNPTYRDVLRDNTTLDGLAAYQLSGPLALTGHGEPARVRVTYCTPSYFTLLGIHPALGRVFRENEDRLDGAEAVVVLSNGFWHRQFASSPDIIGKTIQLSGRAFTVAGVLPASFTDALYEQSYSEPSDAWVPLGLAYTLTGYSGPTDRVSSVLWGIGHLKPGVSVTAARADLAALAKRYEATYPETFKGYGLVARSLRDQLLGEFYAPAGILGVASLFLLLIGCANVGNLLFVRLLSRQREMAVRAAIGASAGQIARHLLIENALLLFVAGPLGIVLSLQGMDALRYWATSHLPGIIRLEASGAVLVVALAISVVTGLLFGVAPAVAGARVDLRDALGQAGRQGQSLSRRSSQKILVVAQVALALVLLVTAGLLSTSFHKLASTDMGFNTANLMTLRLELRSARYAEPVARAQFARALEEKLHSLPGADSVTLWGPSMLGRSTWVFIGHPEGTAPDDPAARLVIGRHSLNPGALANLAIPLLAGREFTSNDRENSPLVAVVSESVAKKFWPGQNAIGKRLRNAEGNFPWITVVGVARDAHHGQRFDLTDAAAGILPYGLKPQYDTYFPYSQRANPGITLAIRTTADRATMAQALREAVSSLDPELPVFDIAMLDERLAAQMAPIQVIARVSAAYAIVAMFLAAFGIFGVIAHDVSQRTQEIGIRMALGALPRAVLMLVLREGITMTVAGLLLGSLAAVFAVRMMQALLYGVGTTEPAVFAIIAAALLAVAIVACWLPARRAMGQDPMSALRQG